MKIFIVCNNLGGGGAERVAVNLANGFANYGHQVWIITDIYQKASYPVDEKVKVLPLCRNTNSKIRWLNSVAKIRDYAKEFHPDVIIGFMHLCSIISRLAVVGMHIPVVMTIHHALASSFKFRHTYTYWLDRNMPRFYSATTVLTIHDLNQITSARSKVFVMPNPLTFPICENIIGKEKVVLAAGRVSDWKIKGFDILIDAWAKVAPKYSEWTLNIAGAGAKEDFEVLKEEVQRQKIQNKIHFLGYRTDMLSLYRSASIFVLSSRTEGLPMVLIEAMSQGCAPVACENLGRTREIIQDDTQGLLFKTGDANSLAESLSEMIENAYYRHSVQMNVCDRAKYYDIINIVEHWNSLLRHVIEK